MDDPGGAWEISRDGDHVVLVGELRRQMASAIAVELRAGRGSRVLVDMHGVTAIDSTVLRVLQAARRVRTVDGGWRTLVLVAPSAVVVEALDVRGLSSVFEIVSE